MSTSTASELDAIAWHASEACRERLEYAPPIPAFLKPPSPDGGPDQDLVLRALKSFGFTAKIVGAAAFDAIALRVMWRNLRDWSAWIRNAEVYENVDCPIVEVTHSDRDVLGNIEVFKQTLRSLAVSPGEHIHNCFHAPTTPFEAALHSDIMAGRADLPRMTAAELVRIHSEVMGLTLTNVDKASFYAVGCLLEDNPSDLLHNRVLGLCIIKSDTSGAIVGWSDAANRPVDPPGTVNLLCRWLENATFVRGSPNAFLRCLRHYQVRFLQACREEVRLGSVNQLPSEAVSLTSAFMRHRIPPPIQAGLVARTEFRALRRLERGS